MTSTGRTETFDCIWCGQPTRGPLEHIVPEAIGCPPGFVLKSDVCQACNIGLSYVDQALVHQFEIAAFMAGVARKGGKPPAIHTWAPLVAARGPEGPEMHINAGPQTVEALGKRLTPAKPSHGILNVSIKKDGEKGTMTFDQEFGRSPKFVRALYKVAIETAVYYLGADSVRDPRYAAVRAFVRTGTGAFRALMLHEIGKPGHEFPAPWRAPDTSYLVVGTVIFGANFLVDFDPEQRTLATVKAQADETVGCTVLPPG